MNHIKNIDSMFEDCSSLKSLPDISKWKPNNLIGINNLFNNFSQDF